MAPLLPLLFLLQLGAVPTDAVHERAAAERAELAGDRDAALLHYENVYDSTPTTPEERLELRAKFHELRPKVRPNTDPAKAGVWKIKVYVFRTLEVDCRKNGETVHLRNEYTDEQIAGFDGAMRGFANDVWEHSMGNLRIEWTTTVVEEPLTHVDGWPDPASCSPHFTDLRPGEADCLMVYANMTGVEPWALWAGTFGCLPEAKGAMYIGFNDTDDGLSRNPTGEVQLHEWLHAAHIGFETIAGYPPGLFVTPDCGGNCSGVEGVRCFTGKPGVGGPGWSPLYYHLMDVHATRRMWRELSVLRPADTPWLARFCREFRVLGPFESRGEGDHGLEHAFVDEASTRPDATWRTVRVDRRRLDLAAALGGVPDRVAYVAVYVRSPEEQDAQVRLGSDDSCKLWHDGKLLLSEPALRAAAPDQNTVSVHLRRGLNLFVMKVVDAGGGWEAIFRVCDASGEPLPGVEYVADPARR